jgi:hypothetical protein
MQAIYKFLEITPFEHDFENVVKQYEEIDRPHLFLGLHDIKPVVKPSINKASGVLGSVADIYKPPYIWD